ncbi:mothers against decapentaplegic homolog 6-like [Xyrichtys novacula]|uniref:Mothers against decapentaplegic homolog 6-like n=1 Tax=Xyrichtys novacula TaxID=13765 RepID=A0AAV1EKT4_XYRNO|nr:mothers against decapentaplegic homolog 6-like [Xyrichtys novacula]
MFKSRRSGLVRRLWRSRLVTESDGRDGGRRGEGGRLCPCGRHSGKLHRHEQRSVTQTDPALGLTGEAGELTESAEREEEEQPDDDRGAMCVQERRGYHREQEGDSRTVTCCLFGEWDLRPRSPYWAPRKDGGGSCQCAPRHAGLEEELASTAHAFLKRLKERSLDTLLKVVEARGGINSECVMVPSAELRLGAHLISPQSLMCKVFRWSDLPLSAWLKTLSHCQSFGAEDSAKVCCNPYHYSRLCGPESPPPPYSLSRSEEHKPLVRLTLRQETTQTLVPPSAPPPPADIALTGAASPTGSSAHAWVACIPPTSPRSTSSMTYLRAQASAWANSTPTPITAAVRTRAATAHPVFMDTPATEVEGITATAAAVYNRYAVKSATALC